MDIKSIQPEATIKVEMVPLNGAPGPQYMSFCMSFISLDEAADFAGPGYTVSSALRKVVTAAVRGWSDIRLDGKDVPCNEATKKEWLPLLYGLQVKRVVDEDEVDAIEVDAIDAPADEADAPADNEPLLAPDNELASTPDKTLIRVLANFAGDANNFLKN